MKGWNTPQKAYYCICIKVYSSMHFIAKIIVNKWVKMIFLLMVLTII